MNRMTIWPILVFGLLLVAGCGGSGSKGPKMVPLAGVVTLNEEPLEGAEINFLHEQYPVGMLTGPGGKYKIPTGAVPGKYKVTISKLEGLEEVPEGLAVAPNPRENPETLPPHYSSPKLTKLTYTVPEEGTESANFDLLTN